MKPSMPSSMAGLLFFGLMYPLPKSNRVSNAPGTTGGGKPTDVEELGELERVDELRIETRGHLNTHTTQEQPDVHNPKVRLPVPWHLVLLHEAGDDGVRGFSNVRHLVGGVGLQSKATRLTASTTGQCPWSYSLYARPTTPASSPDHQKVRSLSRRAARLNRRTLLHRCSGWAFGDRHWDRLNSCYLPSNNRYPGPSEAWTPSYALDE